MMFVVALDLYQKILITASISDNFTDFQCYRSKTGPGFSLNPRIFCSYAAPPYRGRYDRGWYDPFWGHYGAQRL